jgi:hypothetical protein
MGKEAIKAVSEILSNKKKFSRALMVIGLICLTIIIIAGIAFYTGAITYHGN